MNKISFILSLRLEGKRCYKKQFKLEILKLLAIAYLKNMNVP